ncbi:MAG: DUF481 domain-containing protein [Pseudomonadota bacterium]
MKTFLIPLALATACGSAYAEWSGTASLGASLAGGNSEAESISGALRLSTTRGKWEHTVFGDILKGEATVITNNPDGSRTLSTQSTADRLAVGYQPKYFWREDTYLFGVLDWNQDKPADIDSRTTQVLGVGHQFWTTNTASFSAELGIGGKQTEFVSATADTDEAITYLAANYLNRISEETTINADLRADIGSDNTATDLGLGVSHALSERAALKVSYLIRNNSDIVGSLGEKTDTVLGISLVSDL